MNVIPALILTPLQAANIVEQNRGTEILEPRLILGGPYKDKYMIPARALYDPAHIDKRDALTLLPEVALDITLAFPPEEETE